MRDPYDFPVNIIPRGLSYQWVARTVMGDPNPQYRQMLDGGWTPVPRVRHPETFRHANKEGEVEFGGQILMCRVNEKTKEALELNADRAHANARATARRVALVLDLAIELYAPEIDSAAAQNVSCYEFARRRVMKIAEGREPNVGLFGLDDTEGPSNALRFRSERVPRHRALRWLFNLISRET